MLATLRSNRGDEEASFEFEPPGEHVDVVTTLLTMRFRGRNWDGDHDHDISVRVEGLWVRRADVASLRDHIDAWVRRPMTGLDPRLLDARFRLCRQAGQTLDLLFGARADVISDELPLLTVSFEAGRLAGGFHLVVDQSCLDIFARELSAWLATVAD